MDCSVLQLRSLEPVSRLQIFVPESRRLVKSGNRGCPETAVIERSRLRILSPSDS